MECFALKYFKTETKVADMLKKSLMAVVAAAGLAVTLGAFAATAEAAPRHWRHMHRGFGHHGHHGWVQPARHNCVLRKAWRHHHRIVVRVCRPVFW